MTDFYIYSVLLIALSTLFVLVPLLKKAQLGKLQVTNANVVKQRMTELEQEVTEGLISEKDKLSAVRELKLALVEESELISDNLAESKIKVNWGLVGLLSLPAIALGAWVYFEANQLSGLQQYIAAQTQAADLTARIQGQTGAEVTPNDYAKFALVIRKRLRDTPEDVEGWRLLGQVQMAIGQMEESIAAFEKALDIEPRNLDLREKYAQALMATGTEESLENAKRQVDYLVNLVPDNRDYRLLLTVVATQLGDTDTAVQNFMMIRQQLSPGSNFYQSLVAQLVNIGASAEMLNADTNSLASERVNSTANAPMNETINEAVDKSAATPATIPTPMIETANKAEVDKVASVSADESVSIRLEISVAPEVADKLPDSGFLIVFAQNADTDSRIPLAVKRLALTNFPVTVDLTEQDAMMPQMALSSAQNVRITARVSKDADVMPTAGELQGQIDTLALIPGPALLRQLKINKELK